MAENQVKFTPDFNSMVKIVIWNSLGMAFLGFLVPLFAREYLDSTGLEIGLLVSVRLVGTIGSSFISGFLTDKMKFRKNLVVTGSFIRGISYLFIYFALCNDLYLLLVLGSLLLGFGAGFYWIPLNTLISEKSDKNFRSHAFGKRSYYMGIGQVMGAVLGFTLIELLRPTDNPYIIFLAIPAFSFSNFYGGLKFFFSVDETIKFHSVDSKEEKISEENKVFGTFSKPLFVGFAFLLVTIFMSSINSSISAPFFAIYIMEIFGSDMSLAMLAYFPAGIISSLIAPKLGLYVDKIRPELGITISTIAGALITWLLINTRNLWIFSLLLLIDVTIATAGGLIFQNLISRINLDSRGKIFGIQTFITNVGGIIGPIIGGYIFDFNPKLPFITSIFVELAIIPLYWVVIRYLLPHIAEKLDVSSSNKAVD